MFTQKTIALGLAVIIAGLCLLFTALSWQEIKGLREDLDSAQAKLDHQRYILAFEENALNDEQNSLNQALLRVKVQGQAKNDPRPRLILDQQSKMLVFKDSRHPVKSVPINTAPNKIAALSLTWLPKVDTAPDLKVVELSDGSAMMGAAQGGRANPEDDIVWGTPSMDILTPHLYVGMPLYVY